MVLRSASRRGWPILVFLAAIWPAGCRSSGGQGGADGGSDGFVDIDTGVDLDGQTADASPDGATCWPPEPYTGQGGEGTYLGSFQQTYYWLVLEEECSGGPDVDIYDQNGDVLAVVSTDFACKLGLEGSGRLVDGRVINYWGSGGSCVNVTVCTAPWYPSQNCYSELDAVLFPWGKGVRGRALTPYKSIATDPFVIPFGTIVYLPAWDGYVLPDSSVHNGCVRSDDTGGAIIGDHIDFFSGSEADYQIFRQHFPSNVDLYINPERCPYETKWFEAVGAGCCADEDCGFGDGVCLGEPDFSDGYCSYATCSGGDCPDIGGYLSFCTDYFTGGTCVQRCFESDECRAGYVCIEISDLAGGGQVGKGCVPQ
jgi:3D (Asp-Asp-Asp) domain-containing protein